MTMLPTLSMLCVLCVIALFAQQHNHISGDIKLNIFAKFNKKITGNKQISFHQSVRFWSSSRYVSLSEKLASETNYGKVTSDAKWYSRARLNSSLVFLCLWRSRTDWQWGMFSGCWGPGIAHWLLDKYYVMFCDICTLKQMAGMFLVAASRDILQHVHWSLQ